jgi:hypothetical protein
MSRSTPRPRPVIQPVDAAAPFDGTHYAVNLLDRVRPWAYDLYNLLAWPAARLAGARPLVKGVEGILAASMGVADASGAPDETVREAVRETLLIVAYDGPGAFLGMAANPWFALVSALRKAGLDRFRFGFQQRLDSGPLPPLRPRRRDGHLMALFWPDDADFDHQDLLRRVSGSGSHLLFAGVTRALLAIERTAPDGERSIGPTRLAPPLGWGHVAVAAGHPKTLQPLADDLPAGAVLAVLYRRVY